MGVMETKIVQVENDPRVINTSNEAWGRWGWSVLNVQVTHSQNTKEYQDWTQYGSNQVTVETTTINYATITYQRDKGMPNYERIAELEQEYHQVYDRTQEEFKERRAELENTKNSMPKAYEMGCGSIVSFLFSALWVACIAYVEFTGDYRYSMSDIALIAGSIIVFVVLLLRLIKCYSPENRAQIKKNAEILVEIDKGYDALNKEQRDKIEKEKSRIINEAAALLRSA